MKKNVKYSGMWGLHDRQLTLREALHEILVRGSRKGALWRRWKWAEHKCIQVRDFFCKNNN